MKNLFNPTTAFLGLAALALCVTTAASAMPELGACNCAPRGPHGFKHGDRFCFNTTENVCGAHSGGPVMCEWWKSASCSPSH